MIEVQTAQERKKYPFQYRRNQFHYWEIFNSHSGVVEDKTYLEQDDAMKVTHGLNCTNARNLGFAVNG
jgi:hypothetical protein